MADALLQKFYKAGQANGLWDLHKAQSRVHRATAAIQQQTQPDDQGGSVNAPANPEPDGVSVDSFNPITHMYPPATIVMPTAKSNTVLVAFLAFLTALLLALALAAGGLLLSRTTATQPTVPTSPPSTPTTGNEWNVEFFDP